MEWREQVAVVTGGARGIGRATARLLARRGVAVCVNYAAHADAAGVVAAEIVTAGGRAVAVAADVAEPAAVEAMVMRAEAELGPVTILVNNAGVAWQGTLDTYDRQQVARGQRGRRDPCHARRDGGHAGTALRAHCECGLDRAALPGNAFYAAVKAEVLALTRRFALELGPHGIGLAWNGGTPRCSSDDGPHR
jgi:3-oxoacyl-[acyl-carrier protein] reductase